MKPSTKVAAIGLFLALSACSDTAPQAESADQYAARVNGAQAAETGSAPPASGQQYAPKVATPLPGAAAGPPEARTQTDPASASCGANRGADFLGKMANEDVTAEIRQMLPSGATLRVISYGEMVTQDFREKRLNVMLDASGIIRDLRCG